MSQKLIKDVVKIKVMQLNIPAKLKNMNKGLLQVFSEALHND